MQNDWKGYMPRDSNPHVENPEEGFIVACNNKITKSGLGSTIPTTARALRASILLKELINSKQPVTLNHMKSMQTDLQDNFAAVILPKMLSLVTAHKQEIFAEGSKELKIISSLVDTLAKWDFTLLPNDKRALIYSMWYVEICKRLLREAPGDEELRDAVLNSPYGQHVVGNLVTQWGRGENLDSTLCHSERAPGSTQPCISLVVVALNRARERIVARFGANEVSTRVHV